MTMTDELPKPVVDLMAALKQSLEQTGKKPPRRVEAQSTVSVMPKKSAKKRSKRVA